VNMFLLYNEYVIKIIYNKMNVQNMVQYEQKCSYLTKDKSCRTNNWSF